MTEVALPAPQFIVTIVNVDDSIHRIDILNPLITIDHSPFFVPFLQHTPAPDEVTDGKRVDAQQEVRLREYDVELECAERALKMIDYINGDVYHVVCLTPIAYHRTHKLWNCFGLSDESFKQLHKSILDYTFNLRICHGSALIVEPGVYQIVMLEFHDAYFVRYNAITHKERRHDFFVARVVTLTAADQWFSCQFVDSTAFLKPLAGYGYREFQASALCVQWLPDECGLLQCRYTIGDVSRANWSTLQFNNSLVGHEEVLRRSIHFKGLNHVPCCKKPETCICRIEKHCTIALPAMPFEPSAGTRFSPNDVIESLRLYMTPEEMKVPFVFFFDFYVTAVGCDFYDGIYFYNGAEQFTNIPKHILDEWANSKLLSVENVHELAVEWSKTDNTVLYVPAHKEEYVTKRARLGSE